MYNFAFHWLTKGTNSPTLNGSPANHNALHELYKERNSSRRGPSVFSMRFSLQSHAYRGGSHQRESWYWDRINSRIIPTIHMFMFILHTAYPHATGIVTNIKYPSSTRHPHILRSDHPLSCAHNWIFEETLTCCRWRHTSHEICTWSNVMLKTSFLPLLVTSWLTSDKFFHHTMG